MYSLVPGDIVVAGSGEVFTGGGNLVSDVFGVKSEKTTDNVRKLWSLSKQMILVTPMLSRRWKDP